MPRLPASASFLAVFAVPALLLPAIVAHELAHALVARRRGVAVHVVDLRLMGVPAPGDVADRAPTTEALVAIAGPAVSGVLGLVALGIGTLADARRVGRGSAAGLGLYLPRGWQPAAGDGQPVSGSTHGWWPARPCHRAADHP